MLRHIRDYQPHGRNEPDAVVPAGIRQVSECLLYGEDKDDHYACQYGRVDQVINKQNQNHMPASFLLFIKDLPEFVYLLL
jgi:hypothetical protein